MSSLTKDQIRQNILSLRDNYTFSEKSRLAITENFLEFSKSALVPASVITGYYSIGSELNITPLLIELHKNSFKILLPLIEEANLNLKFSLWSPETKMIASRYSNRILEPIYTKEEELLPSVVIAPLIACDYLGNRIGSGKGMYDKKIAQLRLGNQNLLYIGVCYDFQLLSLVPEEAHDQKLNLIITDKRILLI